MGFDTPTTISRLNAILLYLSDELGIKHNIRYRLKYSRIPSQPIATYIVIDDKTYMVGDITLVYDDSELIAVDIDITKEIKYFKDHNDLNYIRKLYYESKKYEFKIDELLRKFKIDELPDDFRKRYGRLQAKYNELSKKFSNIKYGYGFECYGIYANIDKSYLKELLKQLVNDLTQCYDELKKLYTEVSILTL